MKPLEAARGAAFWTLDALKGNRVRTALQTLKNCEDGIWEEARIREYQEEQIHKLLSHARSTVPFYRNQMDTNLANWPVVDKNILRSNGDLVLSSEYKKEDLIRMSTSGSTGTPFTCWQDRGKKKHVNAETLFYNGRAGFSIGRRIIYLRSVVAETQKTGFQQFAQNIYLLDCTDLSDRGIEDKLAFIRKYTKHCGAMIMGYSSTLDAFRLYFEKHGYDKAKGCHVYGVIGGSTMLCDETRASVEKAFSCRCFSRYANEENGFLGQDAEKNNTFLMNRADYYTEILKMESDEPADAGEVGRIVITDLWNYAMPMIRYDTGDVGAWVSYNGQRPAVDHFGGRRIDMIYDADGALISPHSISTAMWKHKEIRQYQFAQIAAGRYEMRLNTGGLAVSESELRTDLEKAVGSKAEIVFKYFEDIPALASGKRRYIVNEEKI